MCYRHGNGPGELFFSIAGDPLEHSIQFVMK
jgi:hypothetical protein